MSTTIILKRDYIAKARAVRRSGEVIELEARVRARHAGEAMDAAEEVEAFDLDKIDGDDVISVSIEVRPV